MELFLKQKEFISNKSRYKVANWGRRSGKTTLFGYEAFGTALTIDNARVTYYAQTFGDARDIAWDIFLEIFGDAVIKKNETLLEITIRNLKGGESKVLLKGWESVVNSQKGRGTENDLLLVDEVAFCRGFSNFWETVLDPTLLTSKGRAVFGSTPDGFNDFYHLVKKAMANKSGDWFQSHATSYDNPFNDEKWLKKKEKEITEDRFSQEYLADFRKKEGLVYKEFDRARHLYDSDNTKIGIHEKMGAIDFGFTHPVAVLSILKDSRGIFWVDDEWYETGKTDVEIAAYTVAKEYEFVYPDPAQPQGIKELKNLKINVREVIKGKDSVRGGIQKIRELFKQGRLKINKECVNLIQELETYSYKDDSEEPIKKNDDALDALRYCILMQDNRKTRQFPVGRVRSYKQNNNLFAKGE